MKKNLALTLIAAAVLATGCTRIETGEVGVRVGYDKQVQPGELMPGSFNQVLIGDVITFPVKDVAVEIDNMTPLARDNSTMKDFDETVIYNVNPTQVSELYATKNRSFHAVHGGDTYLMATYISNAARNATYKATRKYDALDMSDNRAAIETEVKDIITKTLADEGLGNAITVSQVLIRNIVPADSVVASANELVRSKNEFKQKEVEVQTAKKEAERIAALNANQGAIQYMDAQTRRVQADAMLEAAKKGSLMMVPVGATPLVNTK